MDKIKIPFFTLSRQYENHKNEFLEITNAIFTTGDVLQGKEVTLLEEDVANLCNRKYGIAVGSCTDALTFSLMANNIKHNDEVLITSISFFASVSAILRVGAIPCFVDVEDKYYMMDIDKLEHLITSKTKAILAVPLFGQTLPMKKIEDFARKYNLILIEDAAQAIGSFDNNRPAGNMGICSCLSFDPTKVIGSFSSAGMCVTNDQELAKKIKTLRYHGKNFDLGTFDDLGFNSQLPTVMAGMLRFKISKIKEWQESRTKIATYYLEHLSDINEVILPQIREGSTHNWHKFVIRTSRRNELSSFLKELNIETRIHYPRALYEEPLISKYKINIDRSYFPNSVRLVNEFLSLPIFTEMTLDECKAVVKNIRKFFNKK
ncbi:MAG: DegT/DnrJ/EryC1/StrS family aminotransferase [Oligoflexia bacterium]|nr:DegT/DnrJ/EryC1/StrS family aminotransferase [Oligoflexia bacterium]